MPNTGDISAILAFLASFTKALADRGVPLLTGISAKSSRGRAPICCWFQAILYNPSKRFGDRLA